MRVPIFKCFISPQESEAKELLLVMIHFFYPPNPKQDSIHGLSKWSSVSAFAGLVLITCSRGLLLINTTNTWSSFSLSHRGEPLCPFTSMQVWGGPAHLPPLTRACWIEYKKLITVQWVWIPVDGAFRVCQNRHHMMLCLMLSPLLAPIHFSWKPGHPGPVHQRLLCFPLCEARNLCGLLRSTWHLDLHYQERDLAQLSRIWNEENTTEFL